MFLGGQRTIVKYMHGNRVTNCIFKVVTVAAILIVATFCVTKTCKAFDDEVIFNFIDRKAVSMPKDIVFNDKTITETDESGREINYVLKDKQVKIFIDNELIWQSGRRNFVQDMFVDDIDSDVDTRGNARKSMKSKKELVILLWKEGRYGSHRPFWVYEDEKDYSQHIFTYNIEGNKVLAKWGTSYMGEEATSMDFCDGILYLTHRNSEGKNGKSAWKWNSFGFEKLEPVKIFVAGDNLIHEPIYVDALNNHDGDFEYIYKKIEGYTKDADLSIINLETPLVYDSKLYSTYPCFGSPVAVAEAIKKAGFDAVTLSTNHRLDKGITGIEDTLKACDENDIMHVGSMDEKPYLLIKRNNIVFALLNYTYGTNGIRPKKGYEKAVNYLDDEEKIRSDIKEAKENSDFVIVFPHWGTEYKKEPDAYEKKWCKFFYDEGVDVIVGTHPHVYQPVEMYSEEGNEHEMLVFYSLGNYISANQSIDHNTGALGFFEVMQDKEHPYVSSYNMKEIDTMYKQSKYKN